MNQVEGDADRDEQARATVKAGDVRLNVHRGGNDRWHDRHDGQKGGAHVGDADHHLFQIFGCPPPGPIAGNDRPGASHVETAADRVGKLDRRRCGRVALPGNPDAIILLDVNLSMIRNC